MADVIAGQYKAPTKPEGSKSGEMNTADGKKQNPDQVTTKVAEETPWNLPIHSWNPRTEAHEGSKV
jgi:hypothetical protein